MEWMKEHGVDAVTINACRNYCIVPTKREGGIKRRDRLALVHGLLYTVRTVLIPGRDAPLK